MPDPPRILLTRRLPEATMLTLKREARLTLNREDRFLGKSEIIERIAHADGLISMFCDPIDDEVMSSSPNLKVISNYAVGFNNIDLDAATRRRIAVTNTPDVLTETTADLAFALLMAVARRVVEGDRLVRRGSWTGWEPLQLVGDDVHGATLGLVGCGRIGSAVARRAMGFGMQVLYCNRSGVDSTAPQGASYAELDELLSRSDFVSIHVDLNEQTHHLIGAAELARMKPSSYLINTSRGPVIDEAALVAALTRGSIAGAGLDVYENEPSLHAGLVELSNTVITPHIGSASVATRTAMGDLAVANCLAACRGETPPNIINPEVLDA